MNEQKTARLLKLLDGDKLALNFCIDIAFVSEIFDDIYDADKVIEKSQMQDAFLTILTLPNNKFYKLNLDYLQPVIDMATLHWAASNNNTLCIEKRHFFRYLGVQIWVAAIACKIGIEKATIAVHEVWEMSTMEKLEEFKNEIIQTI